MIRSQRLFENRRVRPFASRQSAGGAREPLRVRLDLGGKRSSPSGRGAAENLLRRHPGQIDAGVGMNQAERIVGSVQNELAIHRERFAKPAFLKCQVAQQFQSVVTPRAAECLVDHPLQERRITQTLALKKPALGLAVHAIAVDGPGFGGQLRHRPVSVAPQVDEQDEFIAGFLGPFWLILCPFLWGAWRPFPRTGR